MPVKLMIFQIDLDFFLYSFIRLYKLAKYYLMILNWIDFEFKFRVKISDVKLFKDYLYVSSFSGSIYVINLKSKSSFKISTIEMQKPIMKICICENG